MEGLNLGDKVIALASASITAGVIAGAVTGGIAGWIVKHKIVVSVSGFFGGAILGWFIGMMVGKVLFPAQNGNVIIVKWGVNSIPLTLMGNIIASLVTAIVICGLMTLIAKVDTGASRSSLDINLASELNLGPIIKSKMIKSAHGNRLRPIIEAELKIAGKKIKSEFTLADRAHMKYGMLIGVNILKHDFLVDPSK